MREKNEIDIGTDLLLVVRDGTAGRVVRLEGSIDMFNAAAFERELREIEKDLEGQRLVLDLGGLAYLDLHGLEILYRVEKRAARGRFELELRRGNTLVNRFLTCAGADRDLPFAAPVPAIAFAA